MKRKDLLTKEEFTPLRINQKFARPENRIRYHNKKANEFRHSIAYLSKPLFNNIKILNELMKEKKEGLFHKQFLIGKGFIFGIATHVKNYQDKNKFALHHFLLVPENDDQIRVLKYK